MPSWLIDAARTLFGFATPFGYAYAIYKICMHFDKRGISQKAQAAISSWLQPKDYDKAAVSQAIIELFDRVYSRPLFSWRALGRSAAITTIITLLCLYETWTPVASPSAQSVFLLNFIFLYAISFSTNISSDYAGLFLIRHYLVIGRSKPAVAVFLAPLVGILIVMLFYVARDFIISLGYLILFGLPARFWDFFGQDVLSLITYRPRGVVLGALLVHLWLPLFAFAVGILRLLNYFRVAVGTAQGLLSAGYSHPMEAIGYVTATIVFSVTVVGKLVF
jgi:hypothetical protein